jgi:hypothetical protein
VPFSRAEFIFPPRRQEEKVMENLIVILLIIGVIAFVLGKAKKSVSKMERKISKVERALRSEPEKVDPEIKKNQRILHENSEWLFEKWDAIKKEQEEGKITLVPEWQLKPASERDMDEIRELGINSDKVFTKCEANDILGLFNPMEEDQKEILKFFKVPQSKFNYSRAQYEISKIMANQEKKATWDNRPADQTQREFFRFTGLKMPKNLKYKDAEKLETDYIHFSEEHEDRAKEWEIYKDLWLALNEPETLEDNEIKRVTLNAYRDAFEALISEGKSYEDLHGEVEDVIEKIIEMNPSIVKS